MTATVNQKESTMTMNTLTLATGAMSAIRQFVSTTKLHPVLVNFTAALVPVSFACDLVARSLKNESLRHTAWWTLVFAAVITPFTAITGWLFWMGDDTGVIGMTIHKWLGIGLAVALGGLLAWRFQQHRQKQWATIPYLVVAAALVIALVIQGHLGGEQVFSGM